MKHTLFIGALILGIGSFAQTKDNTKKIANPSMHNIGFSSLLKSYYEDGLKLNPLNATFQGDTRYNDTLPNFLSDAYQKELKNYYFSYLEKSNKFESAKLSESEHMSNAILKWECEINLEGLSLKNYTPIDQMWSMNLMIGQLAGARSAQPFKTIEDYDNWLNRLEDYLIWLKSAKGKIEDGVKTKRPLPKSLITKVLPQLAKVADADLESNLFYSPVKKFPEEFSEADRKRLTSDFASIITKKIIPAYKDLHDFMAFTYLNAGRETGGVQGIPNSDAFYAHQIKLYTTTTLSASEIHEIGLKEVARISAEMERVKNEVGFKGNLKAFFGEVRNKKELKPFTEPEQVIAHFKDIHEKMMPQIERLFSKQPKTAFKVRRTESSREASASAEYNPGSLDGTRPGIFYVPIPDITSYNIYSDEDLFLHEAIPGHHFQISLTQENENLPEFRKTLWYSAYGEGWALYTESLGKELGLYEDPYQYFGMLGAEMHRAVQLVVDTGLHSKSWTREQAIEYSLDNEAATETSITEAIEGYMANPGQALSYKIGQLKILELHAKAATKFGKNFDIKLFHEKILGSGCVPLQILENKIMEWVNNPGATY